MLGESRTDAADQQVFGFAVDFRDDVDVAFIGDLMTFAEASFRISPASLEMPIKKIDGWQHGLLILL
jgi:hypothetical protein